MATPTVGPESINYTLNADGSLTVTATQMFPDGSQAPLQIVIPAYKVPMFYNLVVGFVLPSQYVVPNVSPPTNADVARLVATMLTVLNSPPPLASAGAPPAPTAVPGVSISTG